MEFLQCHLIRVGGIMVFREKLSDLTVRSEFTHTGNSRTNCQETTLSGGSSKHHIPYPLTRF